MAFSLHAPGHEEGARKRMLSGDMISCTVQGTQFDLEAGEPLTMIAPDPIKVFPVKAEGGGILVAI